MYHGELFSEGAVLLRCELTSDLEDVWCIYSHALLDSELLSPFVEQLWGLYAIDPASRTINSDWPMGPALVTVISSGVGRKPKLVHGLNEAQGFV